MRPVDQEKTNERRRQILDAALLCFKEKGFHGAAMSTICKRAHMSPGHVYHYFPKKEDIVEAIIEEDCSRAERNINNWLNSANTVETLLSEIEKIWDSQEGVRGSLNAEITAEASRNPRFSKILRERDERITTCIANTFREGQKKGQIAADVDPEGVGYVILEMISGITAAVQGSKIENLDQINRSLKYVLKKSLT